MASPVCERAIQEATAHGNAILKFISPNDAGLTGSHQAGFYLPKPVWQMYTPHPPTRGTNSEHPVRVVWQDGRVTNSRVKWYGVGTRAEYRLTRFGHDFPFLTADSVGNLLVLIPKSLDEFAGYVFDLEEDIDDVLAALGVQPFERWGVYQEGASRLETEDECIEREFRSFAGPLTDFPSGEDFSTATRRLLEICVRDFGQLAPDDALMRYIHTEYGLFRFVERQMCSPEIVRVFRDVDDFIATALGIVNRRKTRAGRSLENHVDHLLTRAGIPHVMRPPTVDGKPDIVIPDARRYHDPSYPEEKLFIIGVKTTCKDRWRQVLNEGRRLRHKHIITIQPGISEGQLREMHRAHVTLVVPQPLHSEYPTQPPVTMLGLAGFMQTVKSRLSS
jgi:type II restriction enzyme